MKRIPKFGKKKRLKIDFEEIYLQKTVTKRKKNCRVGEGSSSLGLSEKFLLTELRVVINVNGCVEGARVLSNIDAEGEDVKVEDIRGVLRNKCFEVVIFGL